MPGRLTADRLSGLLRPGTTVFVESASAEPLGIADFLAKDPTLTRGVRFVGGWLPGINRFDYARDPDAVMETFFPIRAFVASPGAGRQIVRPLHYTEIFTYLRDVCPVDVAFLQVAPPDGNGNCSLGIVAEFVPAILGKARVIVAEVSSAMPAPPLAPTIPYARLDWIVETDRPPPAFPVEDRDGGVADAIAGHVAPLIRDGDTLQVGLGRIQHAVLRRLKDHRDLALHSGLISDGVLDLIEAGAMPRPLVAAVGLGTRRLYDFLGHTRQVRFASVEEVHFTAALAAVDRFVSINSALEVDLFGQVNAEIANGRRVSGVGGLVDFMRGARASPGGRSILALPATARGDISRIVPRLGRTALVSAARADLDYVVTEHGVAALRYGTIEERAQALIGIAAPIERDALASAWCSMMKEGET
jgi:4-hydroxybutyrate CoA-transferase